MTLPVTGYVQQVEVVVGGILPRAGYVQPVESAGGAPFVTGSGAAGEVTFWTGAQTVSGSNSLFWDNANTRLGIRNASPVAPLHIGAGTDTTSDVQVLVSRTATVSGDSHGYSDRTILNMTGTGGYGAFDSFVTVSGSNNFASVDGFQHRPTFSGTGTITQVNGYRLSGTINAAQTITAYRGVDIENIVVSGGGVITTLYGFYCNTINAGSTNWAIYVETNNSYLGGPLFFASTAMASGTGAIRLSNNASSQSICWRNGAGSQDIGLYVNSFDALSTGAGTVYPAAINLHVVGASGITIGSGGTAAITSTVTIGSSAAASGLIRIPYNNGINWRNQGGSGDVGIGFGVGGTNVLDSGGGTGYPAEIQWYVTGNYGARILPAGTAIGKPSLATGATDGFSFITTCAGPPTGTPTGITGFVPIVYDSTNNQIYVYNGAWKKTAVLT